jgi:hypothetical protein
MAPHIPLCSCLTVPLPASIATTGPFEACVGASGKDWPIPASPETSALFPTLGSKARVFRENWALLAKSVMTFDDFKNITHIWFPMNIPATFPRQPEENSRGVSPNYSGVIPANERQESRPLLRGGGF